MLYVPRLCLRLSGLFLESVSDTLLQTNHPSHHNSMQYSYSSQSNNMDWQTAAYSSERQHLHR